MCSNNKRRYGAPRYCLTEIYDSTTARILLRCLQPYTFQRRFNVGAAPGISSTRRRGCAGRGLQQPCGWKLAPSITWVCLIRAEARSRGGFSVSSSNTIRLLVMFVFLILGGTLRELVIPFSVCCRRRCGIRAFGVLWLAPGSTQRCGKSGLHGGGKIE